MTVMPGWTSSRLVGRIALRTAAGVSLAYILLPMFFVIWLAFFAQEIPSFPPDGYSLKWFRGIPGNDRFVTGFLLSLQVAVVATSIGLAIGVPAGAHDPTPPALHIIHVITTELNSVFACSRSDPFRSRA